MAMIAIWYNFMIFDGIWMVYDAIFINLASHKAFLKSKLNTKHELRRV